MSALPSLSIPNFGAFGLCFVEQSHFRPGFPSLQEVSFVPASFRFRLQQIDGQDSVASARPSIGPLVCPTSDAGALFQGWESTGVSMRLLATSRDACRVGWIQRGMFYAVHPRVPYIDQSMVQRGSYADCSILFRCRVRR